MIKNKSIIFLILGLFLVLPISTKAEDLMESLKIALENNYDYKAKVEQYNANMSQISSYKSYVYPSVDLQASYNIVSGDSEVDGKTTAIDNKPLEFGLQLVQPLLI